MVIVVGQRSPIRTDVPVCGFAAQFTSRASRQADFDSAPPSCECQIARAELVSRRCRSRISVFPRKSCTAPRQWVSPRQRPSSLRAFPIILAGKDLIGTAQTGTGKTAAFALPILTMLGHHGKFRCLVLEPTRELAAQVETAFRDYGRFTDLRATVVHGGVGYGKQRQELKHGVDVVIATPGRLLDHLEQGTLHFRDVNILVLDEVDRMLDMGFLPDVRRIVEHISTDRQTLLFSATLPPEIERLAGSVLREPETIEIGARRSPAETVTHAVYPVAAEQKYDLFMALLERTNFDSALDFLPDETRRRSHRAPIKRRETFGRHPAFQSNPARTD